MEKWIRAMSQNNIFPVFDKLMNRSDKETFLKQRSKVVWMTGLSGSGKSSIAINLERQLSSEGFFVKVLDGDNIRSGLNNNLGFSETDRLENIRRIAEVSKLFLECGIITINCFVSPTRQIRDIAREIIGTDDFVEVYINASLETCETRDVKGLYKKARLGEVKDFTGITAPFEIPESPAIELKTDNYSLAESTEMLKKYLLPIITY